MDNKVFLGAILVIIGSVVPVARLTFQEEMNKDCTSVGHRVFQYLTVPSMALTINGAVIALLATFNVSPVTIKNTVMVIFFCASLFTSNFAYELRHNHRHGLAFCLFFAAVYVFTMIFVSLLVLS